MSTGHHPLPTAPLRVTLVQHSAGRDCAANVARLAHLVEATPPADLIVLPEVFALRDTDDACRAAAAPLDASAAVHWAGALAVRRRAWVLAGSVLERDGAAVYNTSVLLDPTGARVATYRKLHLFEARLDTGQLVREQDVYSAGHALALVTLKGWRCGLSICYDLRFPELYRVYAERGAHLLLAPANFTQRTGKDHWETLVRARAIENQAFVVAADQCGANPATGVVSYGHSLIVGPWGEPLADLGEHEGALTVALDPEALRRTRARIPVLAHRRIPVPLPPSLQLFDI